MDITGILDGKIHLEGETLPTLREIIEGHFVASAGGNAALGKMIATQYVGYLSDLAGPSPAADTAQTTGQKDQTHADKAASTDQSGEGAGFRVGPDAEALLKSMGVPLSRDGRVDVAGALANVFTAEGSKTPLGTLLGAVIRNIGEAPRPRT